MYSRRKWFECLPGMVWEIVEKLFTMLNSLLDIVAAIGCNCYNVILKIVGFFVIDDAIDNCKSPLGVTWAFLCLKLPIARNIGIWFDRCASWYQRLVFKEWTESVPIQEAQKKNLIALVLAIMLRLLTACVNLKQKMSMQRCNFTMALFSSTFGRYWRNVLLFRFILLLIFMVRNLFLGIWWMWILQEDNL